MMARASGSKALAARLSVALVLVVPLFACKEGPPDLKGPTVLSSSSSSGIGPAPSVSKPPEPPPDKFPMTDDQLAKILNPSGATEYTGPTGVVEGVIRVKGDPAPVRAFMPMPKGCESAGVVHAPTFRAGPKGELADAMVTVWKFNAYVRPSKDDKHVTIKNCSIDPTLIDLSLGQRLMISNGDTMPYMPQLATKQIVQRLAIPNMTPVPLILTSTGVFGLTWLAGELPGSNVPTAMIYVLPNALHTVTRTEGTFRITGVPVGKAVVTASHLTLGEKSQDVEIKAGEETRVELGFDYRAPGPSASASAKKLPIPPGMTKPLQ